MNFRKYACAELPMTKAGVVKISAIWHCELLSDVAC